ncbi:hypothetical protein I3843_01G183400 [Carya illinoinensis]|nr:hypothetical protein I3843_01G183400 [Carya illinoinensis]
MSYFHQRLEPNNCFLQGVISTGEATAGDVPQCCICVLLGQDHLHFLGQRGQQLILGQAWVDSQWEIILTNFNHVFGVRVDSYEMGVHENKVAKVLSTLRTRFFEGDSIVTSLTNLDSAQGHGPPLPLTLFLSTHVLALDYFMSLWFVIGSGLRPITLTSCMQILVLLSCVYFSPGPIHGLYVMSNLALKNDPEL